jgi:hypothetical protein
MTSFMNEYCVARVAILIPVLKEMILQDLTYAIDDLEMANRFFGIVMQLDELAMFLNSQQMDLLMEARQLKHLLIQNGYGNLVLAESDRIKREISSLNDKHFLAKENAIFLSTNLSILIQDAETVKGKKRKREVDDDSDVGRRLREIDDDIAEGVVKCLKNNRLLSYLEYCKKAKGQELDLLWDERQKANENRIALTATIESARAAASLC